MIFYLGTHQPAWLGRIAHPLFVSRRRLAGRRSLPRALGGWALDSGGFSELSMFGGWQTSAQEYVAEVRRFRDEIGGLRWAAIQDWMCEPWILEKTGLSVAEHQARSCASYDRLLDLAPELPWAPVLQGWEPADYLRHVELYEARGHRLQDLPIVGVGSVCRRQAGLQAGGIVRRLAALGLRLHGFGFKVEAFEAGYHRHLTSSDSMAWSFAARRDPPLPGCAGHKNCANCARYALGYRDRVAALVDAVPPQMEMFA